MIAIINYRAGNLASVSHALERLDADYVITHEPAMLDQSEGVIFPGVGHAYSAMEALREHGMDEWLRQTDKPILGLCLGMQLLFEETEEGPCKTLGVIPGRLRKFDEKQGKVPHMGWNSFSDLQEHPLLKGIQADDFFYYVHSYYAPVNEYTIGSCEYITSFASIVARDNYMGVQFHPEKSSDVGERLLRNFLDMV